MNRQLNRTDVATLAASGKLAAFNGKDAKVTLQGASFPGTLRASEDGTTVIVFSTPGIYFGETEFEIAGPLYNNLTAQSLEWLLVAA